MLQNAVGVFEVVAECCRGRWWEGTYDRLIEKRRAVACCSHTSCFSSMDIGNKSGHGSFITSAVQPWLCHRLGSPRQLRNDRLVLNCAVFSTILLPFCMVSVPHSQSLWSAKTRSKLTVLEEGQWKDLAVILSICKNLQANCCVNAAVFFFHTLIKVRCGCFSTVDN